MQKGRIRMDAKLAQAPACQPRWGQTAPARDLGVRLGGQDKKGEEKSASTDLPTRILPWG